MTADEIAPEQVRVEALDVAVADEVKHRGLVANYNE